MGDGGKGNVQRKRRPARAEAVEIRSKEGLEYRLEEDGGTGLGGRWDCGQLPWAPVVPRMGGDGVGHCLTQGSHPSLRASPS